MHSTLVDVRWKMNTHTHAQAPTSIALNDHISVRKWKIQFLPTLFGLKFISVYLWSPQEAKEGKESKTQQFCVSHTIYMPIYVSSFGQTMRDCYSTFSVFVCRVDCRNTILFVNDIFRITFYCTICGRRTNTQRQQWISSYGIWFLSVMTVFCCALAICLWPFIPHSHAIPFVEFGWVDGGGHRGNTRQSRNLLTGKTLIQNHIQIARLAEKCVWMVRWRLQPQQQS